MVKNWPKSQKAGESFYKVGLIMQEKGDKAKAKAIYQQVVAKYPGSSGAKLAEKNWLVYNRRFIFAQSIAPTGEFLLNRG